MFSASERQETVVALSGVAKSYRSRRGEVDAVRGVDLAISAGETVALLGPNGAGKSTTLDVMLGLARADRGTATLFGGPPRAAVAAGRVGAMLQTGAPADCLTVRELVRMVASLYPAPLDADEALEIAGIAGIAHRRTDKLSGGQAQRARLAAAIVGDPELLVLDEPTAALDLEARRAFWAAMRSFAARGKTLVVATHNLDEVDANTDRAVLMARGTIVADAPVAELRSAGGTHTVRALLPDADPGRLAELAGVASVRRRGETVELGCHDSDVAVRALVRAFPEARRIEVAGPGLEHAVLELVGAGAAG